MHGKSSEAFLGRLEELVQVSLNGAESVENWWRALYALRQLVDPPSATAGEVSRAEDIWAQAQMLLNETAERYWRYGGVLAQKRNQIVREVGHALVTAMDVTAVGQALAEQLPRLEIPGCYLAAYESAVDPSTAPAAAPTAAARSRLLLAYEDGGPVDIPAGSAAFDSVRLVPGDRLRRIAPYSIVAAPVYFRDQQLGFVLFKLGPRLGWIYAALQEQLGYALNRAFLVERERAASAAVEEAHRREERHRLASELHDSVSQALFSMNLHTRAVQLAAQQQGADPHGRVARGLAELRDLTQVALTEMRALIFQLRPDALHEEGLVVAIRRHVAAVASREGFEVTVRAADGRLPLDEHAERELRYDGPAPIMTPQLADVDLVIGGQPIRKGQLLYPVVGAANRDPARFHDPETLDLTREPNGQLSFGFGIHFCVGAALAKIEGQTYFPAVLTRFPHLRLDPDAAPPRFRDDPLLRGLAALHVRVDPA